jgi:hypothetical protein
VTTRGLVKTRPAKEILKPTIFDRSVDLRAVTACIIQATLDQDRRQIFFLELVTFVEEVHSSISQSVDFAETFDGYGEADRREVVSFMVIDLITFSYLQTDSGVLIPEDTDLLTVDPELRLWGYKN